MTSSKKICIAQRSRCTFSIIEINDSLSDNVLVLLVGDCVQLSVIFSVFLSFRFEVVLSAHHRLLVVSTTFLLMSIFREDVHH